MGAGDSRVCTTSGFSGGVSSDVTKAEYEARLSRLQEQLAQRDADVQELKQREAEVAEKLQSIQARTLLTTDDVKLHKDAALALLLQACHSGDQKLVDSLLDAAADPNQSSHDGSTALWQAASCSHVNIAQLLLDRGARVNATAKGGTTPLMTASEVGNEKLVALLLERKADVNASNLLGNTPLMFAAQSGSVEVARLLLGAGADANRANTSLQTAVMFAHQSHSGNSQAELFALLERATTTAEVKQQDDEQDEEDELAPDSKSDTGALHAGSDAGNGVFGMPMAYVPQTVWARGRRASIEETAI